MRALSIPAALSLSDRPEALVESVWMPLPDAAPYVVSVINEDGLFDVAMVFSGPKITFGCFNDALQFAEACNYEVSMFTLLEHRESFWYEQAYPVSDCFISHRFHAEVAQ